MPAWGWGICLQFSCYYYLTSNIQKLKHKTLERRMWSRASQIMMVKQIAILWLKIISALTVSKKQNAERVRRKFTLVAVLRASDWQLQILMLHHFFIHHWPTCLSSSIQVRQDRCLHISTTYRASSSLAMIRRMRLVADAALRMSTALQTKK